ncbi:glutamate receptor 2.8-like [Rutidosis leptorrhynchoides]|uniref:glutamate receptor 2.8-like n=1 Tax=Rutidosis leptorrhynchoides TaxID=125765 RepID=UPI003A999227
MGITRIGAILDQTTRAGKEAKVSIEIAVQDFNKEMNNADSLLHLQNYVQTKFVHAAIAANDLIDTHNVSAILGGHSWEDASSIAKVISETDREISLLSLAATAPPHATHRWPFFVQAVPTQAIQMNAVAAILKSWGVRQFTLIYETSHSTSSPASIIYYISEACRKTGCVLNHILPLTYSSCFSDELQVLKKQQHNYKVFVVHTSLELGVRLFQTTKKMEMTGDGYLWIATNEITNLFHSVNSTMISSLDGMIGVKSYFPEHTPDFANFRNRFQQKFRLDYPEDEQYQPGIFAVQGYNIVKFLKKNSFVNVDLKGPILERRVEIINVIGKGYHSVYWTHGLGFSTTVGDETITYRNSLDDVATSLWPVQPLHAHRQRRKLRETRMRVAVPVLSLFKEFVNMYVDPENKTVFGGFTLAAFDEIMNMMNLKHDYFPFNGSYDELVETLQSKEFDAVAGDVTILSRRYKYADFTQPYTESGLQVIVRVRSTISNQKWLFMKPFTLNMWWLIAGVAIYNGFVIWLIERNHCDDLRGSAINQFGVIIWLAFTSLFSLRGDKLHTNLSRIVVVVWLFVALIITQSYVASLASMLTAQRLEPSVTSVKMLKNINAMVGVCNGSFMDSYLTDVLGFNPAIIKSYNTNEEYAQALNNGSIEALFLEVPTAKSFLAQYCRSFVRTGETFKVGGFGFAFQKEFSRIIDANEALMNISESGRLKQLEDYFLSSRKCVDQLSSDSNDEEKSLSPRSFRVLFELTMGTSTITLVIYIIIAIKKFKNVR